MAASKAREAKYLYCIIKCSEERSFPGTPAIGGRGDEVHTVVFGDLACVVSDSPDLRYDITRANLLAHEKVIEGVMQEFTVLPIRFGTVTRLGRGSAVDEIRHRLLRGRLAEFHKLHQELDGKVELSLKALWRNEDAIYREIVAENGEIRRQRDRLLGRSAEAIHYDRIRLGEMVKAALDAKRDREAQMLLARFRPLVDRVRENKTVMDRMVLNAAFLVAKEREQECDDLVRRLDEEVGERMVLKYSGPNPPFNFCEIMVAWED